MVLDEVQRRHLLRHNSWQVEFNTRWNYDIKIVQSKEHKLIEAPVRQIRPFKELQGMFFLTSLRLTLSNNNWCSVWDSLLLRLNNQFWTLFGPEN
jgi:hypothetical protein